MISLLLRKILKREDVLLYRVLEDADVVAGLVGVICVSLELLVTIHHQSDLAELEFDIFVQSLQMAWSVRDLLQVSPAVLSKIDYSGTESQLIVQVQ